MSDRAENSRDRTLTVAYPAPPLAAHAESTVCVRTAPLRFHPVNPDARIGLLDNDELYVRGLRVLMLRIMARTAALGRLQAQECLAVVRLCEFVGLEEFEKYLRGRSILDVRRDLEVLIEQLSADKLGRLPTALSQNLDDLASLAALCETEKQVLGFGILVHTETIFNECCELIGEDLLSHTVPRIISEVMDLPLADVQSALKPDGRLAEVGLMTIDMRGRFDLRSMIDLAHQTFAAQMAGSRIDVRDVVRGYVQDAGPSCLTREDFSGVERLYDTTVSYLRSALTAGSHGVNILLHGAPGTGKSQFARAVAAELGSELLEVLPLSQSGAPVSPVGRICSYRMAQAFFGGSQRVLLFDECEEILNFNFALDSTDESGSQPRKSWINHALETNVLPTIWVANSVGGFDNAYLRRFDICLEMPMPGEAKRRKIIDANFTQPLGAVTRDLIARHRAVSPAMLAKAAVVIGAVCTDGQPEHRDRLAIELLSQQLRAQGHQPLAAHTPMGLIGGDFDPELLNCEVDLRELKNGLAQSRRGRLCLYGPPGTGKTAFGRWVASTLDQPHMVLRACDLLAPHLGETEQRIALAFEEAARSDAVLQFDEVDSYLQSRRAAERNWEISQVNEMLTQIERFEGIFIASTNLVDRIDEAAHRRFDMLLRFDYLKPAASRRLFVRLCDLLAVEPRLDRVAGAIDTLANLTPGDFQQVLRRASLIRPADSQAVLETLRTASRIKKDGPGRPAGFMAKVA